MIKIDTVCCYGNQYDHEELVDALLYPDKLLR